MNRVKGCTVDSLRISMVASHRDKLHVELWTTKWFRIILTFLPWHKNHWFSFCLNFYSILIVVLSSKSLTVLRIKLLFSWIVSLTVSDGVTVCSCTECRSYFDEMSVIHQIIAFSHSDTGTICRWSVSSCLLSVCSVCVPWFCLIISLWIVVMSVSLFIIMSMFH